MDVQKLATYGTAVAVVGTGGIVGGNVAIDNATGGCLLYTSPSPRD